MQKNITCPVDFITVNEIQVRTTALLVLLIAAGWLVTGNTLLMAFLIPDFFLRGFNLAKYSPLSLMAKFIVKQLSLTPKPIDQAPKRFAAKIGLLFSLAITVFQVLGYTTTSKTLCAVLLVFAFLECAAGFCAGCHVYTFYNKLFVKKQH